MPGYAIEDSVIGTTSILNTAAVVIGPLTCRYAQRAVEELETRDGRRLLQIRCGRQQLLIADVVQHQRGYTYCIWYVFSTHRESLRSIA